MWGIGQISLSKRDFMRYKESLLLPFFGAIIAVSPLAAQEKTMLKIGGALRFNYNYSDWKPENRNRGGEFDFDVFRRKGTCPPMRNFSFYF